MSKALGLLSGGLDSSLAALALKRQGIEVTCISFVTPFFGAAKAQRSARQMEVPLLVREIGDLHLEMVKNPTYGYGRNMNPCIDCHAMMFRLAGEIMEREGFDFLFSGEVLGQRPMSQNPSALKAVANFSGYPERILRPLSARLLPTTPMEKQGLVDRA
ncbi:MAG: thiamine biosynthesis protein, partial [Desulfuromonadales bacterium]|nr:thiamine biosynthesis protein [Desulfuromonadales bacterium]